MKMIRKKDIKTMIRASRTRPNLIIIARIEKHNPTGEQPLFPLVLTRTRFARLGFIRGKYLPGK